MFKNVASQSIALFAFDTTTGTPISTSESTNLVLYVTKDWGTVTAIATGSGIPAVIDGTNAKGWSKITLASSETNADTLLFTGKSSTANISVVGSIIYTLPANFTTFSVNSINGSVIISTGTGSGQLAITSGVVQANAVQLSTQTVTAAAGVTFPSSVASPSNITAGTITSVSSNVAGSVASVVASVIASSVTGNVGGNVTGSVGSVLASVVASSVTGNIGGNVAGSVGSVTAGVTVTTNSDKTGYSLSSTAQSSMADVLLDRDMSLGADNGSTSVRTPRQAFRALRNKIDTTGGTLTIYKEDDTTTSWTGAITASSAANPITTIDPTGP